MTQRIKEIELFDDDLVVPIWGAIVKETGLNFPLKTIRKAVRKFILDRLEIEEENNRLKEAEREAHNRAIDAAIKIVILDLFSDCGYESFLKVKSELKKLRK